MNTAQATTGTNGTQLAKDVFLEDLDTPPMTVQKIVEETCGERLSLETVLRIGREVSIAVGRALPDRKPDLPSIGRPVFTNHPRLVFKRDIVNVPKATDMAKRGRAQVDVEEKRTWLSDWIMQQARIPTIKEAKTALKDHFGEALGTTYIAQTLTKAHQVVMDERRKQVQPTELASLPSAMPVGLSDTVRFIAALMQTKGIKKVSVSDIGEIDFETTLKL